MGTVFAREKMHILPDKSQGRTGENAAHRNIEFNMETISQLGSVIKLTVLFNLMPPITALCSSFLLSLFLSFLFVARGFRASDSSDGGIRKTVYYTPHTPLASDI